MGGIAQELEQLYEVAREIVGCTRRMAPAMVKLKEAVEMKQQGVSIMNDHEKEEDEKLRELIDDMLPEIAKKMRAWQQEQAAVPWYEKEWTPHICTGGNEKTNIWVDTDDGGSRMIAQACDRETARRLVGLPKLVKAVRDFVAYPINDGRLREALREMGEEL